MTGLQAVERHRRLPDKSIAQAWRDSPAFPCGRSGSSGRPLSAPRRLSTQTAPQDNPMKNIEDAATSSGRARAGRSRAAHRPCTFRAGQPEHSSSRRPPPSRATPVIHPHRRRPPRTAVEKASTAHPCLQQPRDDDPSPPLFSPWDRPAPSSGPISGVRGSPRRFPSSGHFRKIASCPRPARSISSSPVASRGRWRPSRWRASAPQSAVRSFSRHPVHKPPIRGLIAQILGDTSSAPGAPGACHIARPRVVDGRRRTRRRRPMKKIEAIIKPFKLDEVKRPCRSRHQGLTVTEIGLRPPEGPYGASARRICRGLPAQGESRSCWPTTHGRRRRRAIVTAAHRQDRRRQDFVTPNRRSASAPARPATTPSDHPDFRRKSAPTSPNRKASR